MVHGPLINELASRGDRQQHPSRTATLRFAHRREFGPPAIEAPEIAGERGAQLTFRRTLVTKRGEEQLAKLVEDHRVARDQLLAF